MIEKGEEKGEGDGEMNKKEGGEKLFSLFIITSRESPSVHLIKKGPFGGIATGCL